jgi:uncharacterized membrane protein
MDNAVMSDRPDQQPSEPAPDGWLQDRLDQLERLVRPGLNVTHRAEEILAPAWRRVTEGEPRWQVSLAILAAIALQLSLPYHLSVHPRFLLPAAEALLLIALIIANPRRINRQSQQLRTASMGLIALISIANASSAVRLVIGLVQATEGEDATRLLFYGGAIWLTNVIVFALWYWELDRGGPVARMLALRQHPDFLFAQMASPDLAPADWEPLFPDYFYLSFTNATAFSPTDTLPFTRWAKMLMLLQSAVSLATVALVIARAVNILK